MRTTRARDAGGSDGSALKVLVLAGGPDRERPVSLQSGAEVAAALRQAGHDVVQADINESDASALDRFVRWPGDVIFPVLHGPWGEGGGLQQRLDARGLPYVGTRRAAASLCMDKARAKAAMRAAQLPTPAHQVVQSDQPITLDPPAVIKPTREGSSIGMAICHDSETLTTKRRELAQSYDALLIEQYITGREITVGVLEHPDPEAPAQTQPQPLPPIEIVPAAEYYDYHAKYDSDQTQYRFDIDLPQALLDHLRALALSTHRALGARHLSRVDFIVDGSRDSRGEPWILEINTLPGFTTHSLLPMAARQAGMEMPALVDHLVRLAVAEAAPAARTNAVRQG